MTADAHDEQFQQLADASIDRLMGGESMAAILASHPAEAAELTPLLQAAGVLLRASGGEPSPAPRMRAMRRMLDQLERADAAPAVSGGVAGWLRTFKRRPLAYQGLAVVGAVTVFGALGIGASAATGTAPEPVREFLRISASSAIKVELTGVIADIEGSTIVIDVNGDLRTVVVAPSAELNDGGDAITLADLRVSDIVEVKGALQPDNTILATRVRREEDDDPASPTALPATDEPEKTPDDGGRDGRGGEDGPGDGGPGDDGPGDDGPGDDGQHDDNNGGQSDNSGPGAGDGQQDDGEKDDSDDGPVGDDDGDSSGAGGGDDGTSGPGGGADDGSSHDAPDDGIDDSHEDAGVESPDAPDGADDEHEDGHDAPDAPGSDGPDDDEAPKD